MAKNFSNTQTGGTGATPQVGETTSKSTELKKPQGKPADLSGKDNVKSEDNGVNSSPVADTEASIQPEQPVVDVEKPVKEEIDSMSVMNEEIPLVSSIFEDEENPVSEDFSFSTGYEEEMVDDFSFSTGYEEPPIDLPSDTVEPTGEPVEKIYSYPNSTSQYTVKDNKWYERKDDKSEWKEINRRSRALGLNSYNMKEGGLTQAATLPARQNPVKGGVDFEGVRVYGNKYNDGEIYTVQDGNWYKAPYTGGEWSVVDSDRTIKSLNEYHGTDVKTWSDKMRERSATSEPATKKSFSVDNMPSRTSDITRVIEEANSAKPVMPKNIELAGDVLVERGMGFSGNEAEVKAEDNGNVMNMVRSGSDALFGGGKRPSREEFEDEISYSLATYEWDKKNGAVMPPNRSSIESVMSQKAIVQEDMNKALSSIAAKFGEDSKDYQLTRADFEKELTKLDEDIAKAEAGLAIQEKSFQNRLDYMSSDQYEIDKQSDPYTRLAEIQKRMNEMTYGVYSPESVKYYEEEQSKARFDLAMVQDELDRKAVEEFASRDIDEIATGTNWTESQVKQLKEAQKIAAKMVSEGAPPGQAGKFVAETEDFLNTTMEINNRLGEAYNRGMSLSDVLVENKKVLFKENIKLVSPELGMMFNSTLAIRDFMSGYIDSGKIIVDEFTGAYTIADGVSASESEYINSHLGKLIEEHNKVKMEIYSNSNKLITEKTKQKQSLEAAIHEIEAKIKSGDKTLTEAQKEKLINAKNNVSRLEAEIEELGLDRNVILSNDPNKIIRNVSSDLTMTARNIYNAIPDGVTPKNRFDMFYEQLMKKNIALAKKYGISEDYLDRTGEKLRDILDWEYLGFKLTPQEIEYYKTAATLRKMLPLYLNNDWGATEDYAGFWDSFNNSFTKTFAPNTAEAFGFYNETDAVRTQFETLNQLGLTEEGLNSYSTLEKLKDRIDVDFVSTENAGAMVGTSTSLMLSLVMTSGATTGTLKAGKGILSLIEKSKKLQNTAGVVKDLKRANDAYYKTMQSTRLGRYFYDTSKQGANFEVAGMLFNQEDELNFMSGMGGAMAGKMFEGIFKNVPPSKVVEWFGGMFGANTDKAVNVLKSYGKDLRMLKAAHYRGLGEMPEEFAQELISIYRNELQGRGFWDVVKERYFNGEDGLTNLGELLVSSYILGAGMGTAMSTTQQDIWESMSESERKALEPALKDVMADFSVGNANANITADRIVKNNEATGVYGEETKTEENAIQDGKTEEVPVGEQAADSEGVLTEGEAKGEPTQEGTQEERVKAATLDEAKALYEQGYRPAEGDRIDNAATLESIENTWIKGRSVDMVKTAEATADTEVQATEEQAADVEQVTETEKMSLADKIRAGKIDKNTMSSSIIPPSVINAAIEGVALTVETVDGIVQKVQNSEWYQKIKESNPEKAAKVDAELEQLKADVQNSVDVKVDETVKRVKPTEAVKTIKERISQFRKGYAEGEKSGRKLTAEEKKAKDEVISSIQDDVIAYAKENLPKGAYSSADITKMMNRVKNARTMNGLQKAIDTVDSEVAKFEEATRVDTADRIIKTLKNPQTKRRSGKNKKVGKISVEAREKLKTLVDEVGVDNIPNMTQEQLTNLEERIDGIIESGVQDVKAKEKSIADTKRSRRAVPFTVLASQNKATTVKKSGEQAINDFFRSKQGAIVLDGRLFTGIEALKTYLNDTGQSYESIGEVDAVISRATSKDATRKYEDSIAEYNKAKNEDSKLRWYQKARKRYAKLPQLRIQEAMRTLENRMMGIYRGSKELRDWTNENILNPVNEAYINRDNGRMAKQKDLQSEMKGIFGRTFLTGIPRSWNKDSGVRIFTKGEGMNLSNGQLVNVGMMLTSEPSAYYEADGKLYATESEAKRLSGGKEVTAVESKYNPNVLIQISEDQSIESGLAKAKEIENAVNSDKKLKAASDLFKSKYKEYRDEYEQVFIDLYDMKFKDGEYVPMTRSMEQGIDTDVVAGTVFNSSASAISDNLKQRYNGSNVPYDFTTDAYVKILEYVNTMEHSKNFLPVAESMRDLMSDAVKAQIIQKIGARNTLELKKHMDRILSDGRSAPLTYDAMTRLSQFTVVTTLAGKLASIPKQLTSATHYLGAGLSDGVGTMDVLAQARKLPQSFAVGGMNSTAAKFALKMMGAEGDVNAKLSETDADIIRDIFSSAFIQNRYSGKDIDTETRQLVHDMTGKWYKNGFKILVKAAMSPTILGDIGGVLTGGIPFTLATYYNNVNNKGMSHEEAKKDAVNKFIKVSNQTQQSQRDDILSNAQKDPVYRIFLTYTTSQVAAMAELTKAAKILTDRKGEYTSIEKKAARRKFGYYLIANSVFQVVASGALGMYLLGADDDDERDVDLRRTAIYGTLMDTVSSNLQGFGLTGKFADFVLNSMRNREIFNNIPVIERMVSGARVGAGYGMSVLNTLTAIANGDMSAEDFFRSVYLGTDPKNEKELMKLLGFKNISDTYKSWDAYVNGEGDDMTWWDAIMNRIPIEEGKDGAGSVYATAKDRDDKIYKYMFGEESMEIGSFFEHIQDAMTDNPFEGEGFTNDGGIFSQKFNENAAGNIKSVSGATEVEPKERNYEELVKAVEVSHMEDRISESISDRAEKDIKKRAEEEVKAAVEEDKNTEKATPVRDEYSRQYREKFGEDPDESWSTTKIMNKVFGIE